MQLRCPLYVQRSVVNSVPFLKKFARDLANPLAVPVCVEVTRFQQIGEHLHTRHHQAVILLFECVVCDFLRTLIGGLCFLCLSALCDIPRDDRKPLQRVRLVQHRGIGVFVVFVVDNIRHHAADGIAFVRLEIVQRARDLFSGAFFVTVQHTVSQ
ncbi:hypothetical protein SDC9_199420 [bioreactor metagenome]|uniref:Uncharacterized protein n=1 Tax=bioreactor metagenome TaxID=1076179 RepID=A0A645IKG8_9ZZZZ